ncbi:ANTAR domain-containing protein [Microvirga tunisiensis]|uniref:ANTAR domain-containing protein n=2 Tax=Pannonibacter tanglangensis TaxID=2750084 RepID=A0ABW9ZJT1_9HYPH|nr:MULTISPECIES: ANTAR domain-containing protein [unclassified Pannonibacter]NBN65153.1 ANTAR domain-containing protein [Pannonibacter sp. XCT-34]NBN79869.1 ANTAR domain-containing protein [Pannonibacter sp. XCT-53]
MLTLSARGPAPAPAGRPVARPGQTTFPFADISIGVITERTAEGDALIRELQKLRARPQHVWPVPATLPTGYDVLLCDLVDDLPTRVPWLPGEPESALIALLPKNGPFRPELLRDTAAHGVLVLPSDALTLQCTLALARDHFRYEQRLRGRIDKLDENLRNMRSVERAKSIIMHRKGMNEEDAYQFLRRQAMSKRVSIGAIANAIVDSQELLG